MKFKYCYGCPGDVQNGSYGNLGSDKTLKGRHLFSALKCGGGMCN